jgi:hypothetical protein
MSFEIFSKQPKYPPIKDGNQVCYLLLHIAVPSKITPPRSIRSLQGVKSAQKAAEINGIKIWPTRVSWQDNKEDSYFRYCFCFKKYKREERKAMLFAECFLNALSFIHGPVLEPDEDTYVFRVPAELARAGRTLIIDKLLQIDEARHLDDRTISELPSRVLTSWGSVNTVIDHAWRIVPILFNNPVLCRAVQFIKTSQDDSYFYPGEISEVIANPDRTAQSGSGQSKLENALQNAFKAIEAILGDPPKDDKKFFDKIKSVGLDPMEEVGYSYRFPLHTVIRDMNDYRDKKAAHGSTQHRVITFAKMMEFQACAHYVVNAAIQALAVSEE